MRRLIRNTEGATAVEFAIVATAFFMLIMGLIEFGLYMVSAIAIESAVAKGGRSGAICSASVTTAGTNTCVNAMEAKMRDLASGLINGNQIYFTETPVSGSSTPYTSPPDLCFPNGINAAPDLSRATCDCTGCVQIEGNGKPGYQQPISANNGGLTGDLVEIRATYPWHILFPFIGQFFAKDGVLLISSSTVVKNE